MGEPIRFTLSTQSTSERPYTQRMLSEAVHRQFRKLTKTKGGFPNENSLLKLLRILNASKKWTMPIQNWNMTLSQLAIHFDGRLDDVLDI